MPVPFFRPGGICERTVDFMTIYPTLCELAKVPVPKFVEGPSIVPLLRNPAAEWKLPAITTHGYQNHTIRTEAWRYIRYADGSEELYDEAEDPYEWTNLAESPERAAVKAELSKWLPVKNAPAKERARNFNGKTRKGVSMKRRGYLRISGAAALAATTATAKKKTRPNLDRINAPPSPAPATPPVAASRSLFTTTDGKNSRWERSYKPGYLDSNGNYMGGTEIQTIVAHKGKLYAGNSFWMDPRNPWYGGMKRDKNWAQVLRLDGPNAQWQSDLELGPIHIKVHDLESITFTQDENGNPLAQPLNLLVLASSAPSGCTKGCFTFAVHDDENGGWIRQKIVIDSDVIMPPKNVSDDGWQARCMAVHRDKVTGIERLFLSLGKPGILSGVYDPNVRKRKEQA